MTLHSSQLGRGGHRDDRRRRLLAEDRSVNPDLPSETEPASRDSRPIAHKSENYGDAEFLQTQLRLTDLVPRRVVVLVLLPLAGASAIAGLITLYVAAPRLFRTPGHWPALAVLGGPGSLSNWFSSLLLLMATFYAVANYTVRRHRMDDYRGRYRMWLWAAACCFLMASDAAASLHQGVREALISATGTRIIGDGSIWWLLPAALLLGYVGTRLLIDTWPCRVSSAALILAAIAYIAALMPFFRVIRLSSDVTETVLLNGLLLAGHFLLVWSMLLHARFVLLDAEGRLSRTAAKRQAKRKRAANSTVKPVTAESGDPPEVESAAADASAGEEVEMIEREDGWIAVDPPHNAGGSSGPSVLRRVGLPVTPTEQNSAKKTATVSPGISQTASEPDNGKLSKADRKALKKKLLQDRLKAEQRKAANW